jgi:hypothetical protein
VFLRSAHRVATRGALVASVATCACARPTPSSTERAYRPPVAPAALEAGPVVAPVAPSEPRTARWSQGDDAGDAWTRTPGAHAPALVLRGVSHPTHPDVDLYEEGWQGARFGATPLTLALEGEPRPLHVWGRARGPLGLRGRGTATQTTAIAAAGDWARLDLESVTGNVTIDVADVDHRGERRGQTSPYVIVVTDEEATPAEQPDERPALDPRDVTVRWALAPTPCPQGLEGWTCARPTLQLGGAVSRSVPLKHLLLGQAGCWPNDTGITCAGPSGDSDVELTMSRSGVVEVRETSESDGYCEPGTPGNCQTVTAWAKFSLRPGVRLVADPAGTLPPPE